MTFQGQSKYPPEDRIPWGWIRLYFNLIENMTAILNRPTLKLVNHYWEKADSTK